MLIASAALLKVDLLFIATNTNGIYTKESIQNKNPKTIQKVDNFEKLKKEVIHSKSSHGSGELQP